MPFGAKLVGRLSSNVRSGEPPAFEQNGRDNLGRYAYFRFYAQTRKWIV